MSLSFLSALKMAKTASLLRSEVYWQVLSDIQWTSKKEQPLHQYHVRMYYFVFERTRKVLLSKEKEFKKKGKGNKPNASVALTSDELNTLDEKGLLGTRNPEALSNTLWLNNTMHFGLRGCKEHRQMCWGDVKLKQNSRQRGL